MIRVCGFLLLLICHVGCHQQPAPPAVSPDVGTEATEASLEQRIEVLLNEGRKIEAIRVYRSETGVGLKEARDVVDEMDRKRQGGQ